MRIWMILNKHQQYRQIWFFKWLSPWIVCWLKTDICSTNYNLVNGKDGIAWRRWKGWVGDVNGWMRLKLGILNERYGKTEKHRIWKINMTIFWRMPFTTQTAVVISLFIIIIKKENNNKRLFNLNWDQSVEVILK